MNPFSHSRPIIGSSDLIGCRFRLARDISAECTQGATSLSTPSASVAFLCAEFPELVDRAYIVEGGEEAAQLDTLEAIARGEDIIVGAVLTHERTRERFTEVCRVPLLIKIDDAPTSTDPTYAPVIVVPHRLLSSKKVKRGARGQRGRGASTSRSPITPATVRLLSVGRLSRSGKHELKGVLGGNVRDSLLPVDDRKLKHHGPDAVRLGQAAALLHRLGVSSGLVGALCRTGDDLDARNIVMVTEDTRVESYRLSLQYVKETINSLDGVPSRFEMGKWPLAARRIRECRTCKWQQPCAVELAESDDISLLLPGDKANTLRDWGITTVRELAEWDGSESGGWQEQRWLARAKVAGIDAVRKVDSTAAPRADVEMDIDMEAYPHDGAYLWGTWVPGEEYRPFATWAPPSHDDAAGLGGAAEARNFAKFWLYLMQRKQSAEAAGRSFRAYCWAAEGENYWLRRSADKFGGMEFEAGDTVVRVPDRAEVDAFISSDCWIDMFRVAKSQILSVNGLGLKTVAPWAGFHWRDQGIDGEASLDLYRIAAGWDMDLMVDPRFTDLSQQEAQEMLLRYNGDDCRSVSAIRQWLDDGTATRHMAHGKELPNPGT